MRLYDDIIKLSEVPPKIIYHELVRAPISRAKAKQTNLKVGELSREGVGKAVNWLIEKDLKPTRGKVLDWLSKNRYTESCERHTNRLIAKAMRITQK